MVKRSSGLTAHLGETLEVQPLLAGDLCHGTLRRDVSVQALQVARLFNGRLQRHDHLE